jgi:hypothetical protein
MTIHSESWLLFNDQSWLSGTISYVQILHVSYTLGQWVFICNIYVKQICERRIRGRFHHKLQDVAVIQGRIICTINKLRHAGSLLDTNDWIKHWLLNKEKLYIPHIHSIEVQGFKIVSIKEGYSVSLEELMCINLNFWKYIRCVCMCGCMRVQNDSISSLWRKTTNSMAINPQMNYSNWATATCRRSLVPTFADREVSCGQRGESPTVVNLSFLDRNCYFSFK